MSASWIGGLSPAIPASISRMFHPGLAQFRASLYTYSPTIRDYTTGTVYGCGGVQIGIIGDSLLYGNNCLVTSLGGAAGASWHIGGYAQTLRRALQAQFAQPSNDTTAGKETGGYGLMQFVQGHTGGEGVGFPGDNIMRVVGTKNTHWSLTYAVGTVGLGGKILTLIGGSASGYVRIDAGANLTDTPLKRDIRVTGATHLQLVGNTKVGAGTLRIDINATTSLPAVGAGAFYTGTWNMASGSTVVGARSQLIPLTATGNTAHTIALYAPAAAANCELTGAILWGEDLGSGIQVHQLGGPGAEARHWSAVNLAGLNDFTSGYSIAANVITPLPSVAGANNMRAVVIDFITNDMQARTKAQYGASMREIIAYLVARPTIDVIIMKLPVKPDLFTRANWNDYAAVFKAICSENPNVCVLDDDDEAYGLELGNIAYELRPTDARWDSDGTHYTPLGSSWSAGRTASLIMGVAA